MEAEDTNPPIASADDILVDSDDEVKSPEPSSKEPAVGDTGQEEDPLVDSDDDTGAPRPPVPGPSGDTGSVAEKSGVAPEDDEFDGLPEEEEALDSDADVSDSASPSGSDDEDLEDENNEEDAEEGDEEEEEVSSKKRKRSKDKKSKKPKKEKKEKREKKSKRDSSSKPKKRSRGADVSRFFADAAEDVDDEEDEGEYERLDKEDIVYDEHEAAAIRAVEQRHAANREQNKRAIGDIADDIVNRYKKQATVARRVGVLASDFAAGAGAPAPFKPGTVAQQSFLPGLNDPHIFMVRCKPGKEQLTVRGIMLKALEKIRAGKPAGIKSAFCSYSKGWVYVESVAEPLAREAVQGFSALLHYTFKMVPIPQMTALLSFKIHTKPLKDGAWVRLKRGALKGDLARVVKVLPGGDRALIQAVPRIDYTMAGERKSRAAAAAGAARPTPALFKPEEATVYDPESLSRRRHPANGESMHFFQNDFYKDGFLFKDVVVNTYLQTRGVAPQLVELQRFRSALPSEEDNEEDDLLGEDEADGDGLDEDDGGGAAASARRRKRSAGLDGTGSVQSTVAGMLAELADMAPGGDSDEEEGLGAGGAGAGAKYIPGDIVQTVRGELSGLVGRVTSVDPVGGLVNVEPLSKEHRALGSVSQEAGLLAKYVQAGTHIKVVHGPHAGQTGTVVSVLVREGTPVAAVLTDGVNTEISVNVDHLRASTEVAAVLSNLQGYELYDLVVLSQTECAVITVVGTEMLTVINHAGKVKTVTPQELRGKKNQQSARTTTFDGHHEPLRVGNAVNVTSGVYARRSGTVKHIFKSALWLHSNSHLKDSGVFVVRSRDCVIAGNRMGQLTSQAMISQLLGPASSLTAATGAAGAAQAAGQAGGGVGGGGGGGPRKGYSRDPDIGKTCRITKGGFKGSLGQIRDADEDTFTVQLLKRASRTVHIERSKCVLVGDKNGAYNAPAGRTGAAGSQAAGWSAAPDTPFLQSETPNILGGETPTTIGGETPLVGHSSDVYDPFTVGAGGYTGSMSAHSASHAYAASAPGSNLMNLGGGPASSERSPWGAVSTGLADSWGGSVQGQVSPASSAMMSLGGPDHSGGNSPVPSETYGSPHTLASMAGGSIPPPPPPPMVPHPNDGGSYGANNNARNAALVFSQRPLNNPQDNADPQLWCPEMMCRFRGGELDGGACFTTSGLSAQGIITVWSLNAGNHYSVSVHQLDFFYPQRGDQVVLLKRTRDGPVTEYGSVASVLGEQRQVAVLPDNGGEQKLVNLRSVVVRVSKEMWELQY
jgi:transcription elongation factor SPT5